MSTKSSTSDKKDDKKRKRKIDKQTLFVILAIINIMWYTIVVLVLSYHDHAVQSELTTSFFKAWTLELFALATINIGGKAVTTVETIKTAKEEVQRMKETIENIMKGEATTMTTESSTTTTTTETVTQSTPPPPPADTPVIVPDEGSTDGVG